MKIDVEKVLTEDEWYFLDAYDDERDDPGYFDDNLDDWIRYWYSKGYRFVKLASPKEDDELPHLGIAPQEPY